MADIYPSNAEIGRAFADNPRQMQALLPSLQFPAFVIDIQPPFLDFPLHIEGNLVFDTWIVHNMALPEIESGIGYLHVRSKCGELNVHGDESTKSDRLVTDRNAILGLGIPFPVGGRGIHELIARDWRGADNTDGHKCPNVAVRWACFKGRSLQSVCDAAKPASFE